MSGWAVSTAPTSRPKPCTTLNTPSGIPACLVRSAKNDAVRGVHSAGFKTTVSPEARAGPIFQVASISGAFHGVIKTATPDGSHEMLLVCPRVSNDSCLSSFIAHSAKKRMFIATRGITPRRCERKSEPLSMVSICASVSMFSSTSSASLKSSSPRLVGPRADQAGNARLAAATASFASSSAPREISPRKLPSTGEVFV